MFKELKLKNLGDYHYLHVQSDTLLLADVFQNFRNKCIEIFELEMLAMLIPVQTINFLSAPEMSMASLFKKD